MYDETITRKRKNKGNKIQHNKLKQGQVYSKILGVIQVMSKGHPRLEKMKSGLERAVNIM